MNCTLVALLTTAISVLAMPCLGQESIFFKKTTTYPMPSEPIQTNGKPPKSVQTIRILPNKEQAAKVEEPKDDEQMPIDAKEIASKELRERQAIPIDELRRQAVKEVPIKVINPSRIRLPPVEFDHYYNGTP